MHKRVSKAENHTELGQRLQCILTYGYCVELYNVHCYTLYEHRRDKFLWKTPHARAALRAGGIIWRLAVEILDQKIVKEGLTKYTQQSTLFTKQGTALEEDILMEEEQDYICGLYTIPKNSKRGTHSSIFLLKLYQNQASNLCMYHDGLSRKHGRTVD